MFAKDIWTKPFRLDMQFQVKRSISSVEELQIEGTTMKHNQQLPAAAKKNALRDIWRCPVSKRVRVLHINSIIIDNHDNDDT